MTVLVLSDRSANLSGQTRRAQKESGRPKDTNDIWIRAIESIRVAEVENCQNESDQIKSYCGRQKENPSAWKGQVSKWID